MECLVNRIIEQSSEATANESPDNGSSTVHNRFCRTTYYQRCTLPRHGQILSQRANLNNRMEH